MATFTFDTTAVRDYTIVDHGGLDNAAPVTLTAAELTNLQYTTDGDVVLSQNGTGSLSSGGFAIGEHLRFATDSGSRWFTFTYDALLYNQIEITGIKGNGSNGGEEPDNGEDLILQYLDGGSNWVTIDTIIAENDTTFNTLKTAVIALPQAAQNNSQAFRLYQENASGSPYDHYGISSVKFTETVSGGSPTEDYGLITTTATATEEYQEIVFTDVAYPFGKAKISGGAQAAVSSAPPTRTVEIKTQGISTESNTSVWVGSGTAFEMAGGQELIVAPWTVASGVLRTYRTTNSFVGSGDLSIRDRYQIENTTKQERVVTQISADPEEYEVSYISVPTVREIDEDVRFSPSYNTSSVEYFEGGTDYGSVTQSSSTNLDNGNLQEGSYGGADYGLVNVTQDDYPFLPALNLHGSAVTQYKPLYTKVATGLFNFTGGAKSEFKPNWRGRGGIFVAGSAQDSFIRPAVIEGGSIVSFNESENSASYRYTESSVEEFDSNDFGQITATGSATDYGTVTEGSYASFDYGYVFNTDTVEPYGLFSLQGFAEYAYKPTFTHRGSGSISIYDHYTFSKFNPHWRGRGGFSISGGEGDVFSRPAVVEGGSLVSFNQSANSAAYSYNESSVEEFSSNDFGQITASGSSADYGTVTEGAYAGFDYGYVFNTDTVEPYGLYTFSGSARTSFKPTFTQIGTGLFAISGVSKNEFKPHWRGRGGIVLSGGERDVFSRPAVVEGGSLVSFNQSANSAAYSYNESSIELFSDTDFGQITATGSTTDYGSVTEGSYAAFDHGYVFNTIDQYPLDINALFAISGVANVEYNPELKQIGDGLYNITGFAESAFLPHWRGRGGIIVSGGEADSVVKVFTGTGSLFSVIDSEERAAYSYNESSIEFFSDTDFGQITATGSSTDYGAITEGSYAAFDHGYVFNVLDTYPLDINSLFSISGVANVEYNPELSQTGSGGYNFIGTAESSFLPHWRGRGGLFLSGGERDSVVKSFAGTGSLFSIIDSEERAAYSYNESSIEFFNNVDLGTITATGTTVDYGNLTDGSYGGLDYGYVFSTQDDYPFDINSLFAISGSADVEFLRNLMQIGTGLYNISGDAATIFKPHWRGRGGIIVSGGERDSVVKVFTASGSLFHIGEKIERATFSYNSSSIDYFNDLDRGSITNSGSQEDNGSVAEDSYAGFDYGTVINTSDTYPFGGISISGGSADSAELKVVVGGNLFGFGGAAEAVSWQTPENTALYSFNGGYSNLKATVSEVGEGSLFNYKGQFAPTDFTFRPHWRGRGVIRLSGEEGYIRLREFVSRQGSISVGGSAHEAFVAQTPEDTVLFTYSGTRVSEKATAAEVGSGSLFAIGTLVEAQTDFYTVPVSTSLFNVSGAAGVAQADNYNSRGGTLKIYTDDTAFNYRNYRPSPRYVNAEYGFIGGQLNIAGELDEAFTQPYIGSGNATVTGIADTDRARDYVGTGSFNSFSGAAESRAIAINAETSLYRAFGSGDDSVTKINIGSGSLFTAGGAAESRTFAKSVTGLFSIAGDQTDTRYVPNFNGSGTLSVTNSGDDAFSRILIGTGRISTFSGAAEAFVAQTPENTALYSFNGTATESFSKGNYDGVGSVFTSGFSTEKQTDAYAGTGSLFAAGGAAESRTIIAEDNTVLFTISLNTEYVFIRGPYPGRGSLFAAGGAAEAFVAQTPENTALYSFFGNRLSEKRTSSEVGSGSLFTAGSGAESRVISQVAKTDLFTLTGSAEESFSQSPYKGTGSLFASSGAAESRTIIAEDNTVLYTFSGTRLSEKATVREIGSGSLFSTGGITESRTIARSQTGLFNITGESTEIFTRGAYPSSGSLFAAGGAAEAFSAQTPENTVLYTFFGNRLNESKTTRLQGSGSLFTFGGSVERAAVAEESTGLFSISGTSEINFTRGAYPSSGSLFATGGAAESRTIIAEDNTILFTASGTADEKFTRSSTTESAQYSFSGELAESKTSSEVGSGSLFSAGGAAEVAAVSPESTGLFNINGSTDDAFARTVIGSGSLFSVGSADEAKTTFVPIDPGFYRLVGSADESFTPAPHIGSGSATLSGTTSPEIRTLAKHGSGSATISGTAEPVIRTHAFQGSGTITLSGQTEFKLKYQTDATTILFTYQGGEGDAFTRIARTNTVEIRIDGESENRSILFTPPRIFGTII